MSKAKTMYECGGCGAMHTWAQLEMKVGRALNMRGSGQYFVFRCICTSQNWFFVR